MKKLIITGCALVGAMAIAFGLAGCQTRITAEKNAEKAWPIQEKVTVNGTNAIITVGWAITSGGWEATARSPLWADENLRGLDLGVATNGSVYLKLDDYHRDLSTNAVIITKEIFVGVSNIVDAAAAAYAKIATAGASDAVSEVAKNAIAAFVKAGGNTSKAEVAVSNGTMTVSDGTVCTTCDANGNCTSGACSE